MGLDMYVFATKKKIDKIVVKEPKDSEDVVYWRKFNNLHGWMEELYIESGGVDDFNCVGVKLSKFDLDKLKEDAPYLEPTVGCFFGAQEKMTEEMVKDLYEDIEKIRAKINEGYSVYYTSWW